MLLLLLVVSVPVVNDSSWLKDFLLDLLALVNAQQAVANGPLLSAEQ